MRNRTFLLFVLSISFLQVFSQSGIKESYDVKTSEVTKGIYMLEGQGGNIGLSIGDDGIFMIDDQFARGTEEILKSIKKLSAQPISFLLNTHHHGDHTGGNVNLAEKGAIIVSHENVRGRLAAMEKEDPKNYSKKNTLPIITFSEDIKFHYNGDEIFVFHVHDAHTDGDALVYFTNSNVLHTGDTFFNGGYPYIDVNSGGTLDGYINALKKITMVANQDTKIIPGHGKLATIDDVKKLLNILVTLKERISSEIKKGKTKEEIIGNTEITSNFDEQGFGDGFINSEKIRTVIYNEIIRVSEE